MVQSEADVWNRTALYADTFRTLARYGYPLPVIAEALHPPLPPSFLEQYGRVIYTDVNDERFARNQGVNEARSLLVALAASGLADDTMLVQLTMSVCLNVHIYIYIYIH